MATSDAVVLADSERVVGEQEAEKEVCQWPQDRRSHTALTGKLSKDRIAKDPTEYEEVVKSMQVYIQRREQGKSPLMRPAFCSDATISGYRQGVEYSGSIANVLDWATANGPAPNSEPALPAGHCRAIVLLYLEVQRWSGKLAGRNARASDVFTLLRYNGEWNFTRKCSRWHE